ncbi:hypothetical protein Salat_0865900 [Sesamum alatum]|uniref:Uncharacterized protein n=1 Tax=Sesamum alatum TaxID=300844 RepID=A0AAE1YIS3_9LAMI|nr:hypothetical protein Salat_0865900 [Sesamum alatum]
MASTSEGAFHDNDSESGTPGTPGSPGSNESDVPEKFYYFRDLVCPELFRENIPPEYICFARRGMGCRNYVNPSRGQVLRQHSNDQTVFLCISRCIDVQGLPATGPNGTG